MRSVVNAGFDPTGVPAPSNEAAAFPTPPAGLHAPPLHALTDIAKELGVGAVLVKDESDRLGLPAFKILGASWAVERALRERPHTHTLVAASAENHGRAVARAAALRGMACRIYLPAVRSPFGETPSRQRAPTR